jgi:Trp operon repressor
MNFCEPLKKIKLVESGEKLIKVQTLTDGNSEQSPRKSIRTRRVKSAFVSETFCADTLPKRYHKDVITAVCEVLLDRNVSKSEFCRSIFLDSLLAFLSNFSQRQIAQLLGVAVSLVNRCKAQAEEARTAEARRETGRPAFLNAENK